MNDLNTLIADDGGHSVERRTAQEFSYRNPAESENAETTAYFRDLASHLDQRIREYPVVVGCVAWLTNERIIRTLSERERVSLIIQKEDFLRPDTGSWSGQKLRKLYGLLPPGPAHDYVECWGDFVDQLNQHLIWQSEPVRWMGNFNTEKHPAFPRMHNKFLVFCDIETAKRPAFDGDGEEDFPLITPRAVWTGSFNMTDNATKSLENAVFMKDASISRAYFDEWQHVFSLSEPIGYEAWENKWCPPEWFRVGT